MYFVNLNCYYLTRVSKFLGVFFFSLISNIGSRVIAIILIISSPPIQLSLTSVQKLNTRGDDNYNNKINIIKQPLDDFRLFSIRIRRIDQNNNNNI